MENKKNTIYVGNFKKSELTVCIYSKRSQSGSVKKYFSSLKTHIESIIYTKKQEITNNFHS